MSFGLSASDCISLPHFVWKTYKALRDSPHDFAELSSEVASMHAALCSVKALVDRHPLSAANSERLGIHLKGCHDVLKALEGQLGAYDSLGRKKKRMRDRTRWAMESVGEARIRLLSHTAMLNLSVTSLVGGLNLSTAEEGMKAVRLDVPTLPSRSNRETANLSSSADGVFLPCLRCAILKITCARGIPCRSCDQIKSSIRELTCRRGPLKTLARDLIPSFFLPCVHPGRREQFIQQYIYNALGQRPINVRWGLVELDVSLGTPTTDLDTAISFQAREAMVKFQETFPDRYQFRVQLIDEALRYQSHHSESAPVIAEASQFLVLSLLIAHNPVIQIPEAGDRVTSAQHEYVIGRFVEDEVHLTLASLLISCLRNLLDRLQDMMSKRRRADWLPICFALSLMFFAAESMQVDIHLRSANPFLSCESMEMRSILVLAELFSATTLGFDPLGLDWTRAENAALIENDTEAIESFKALQILNQDYWGFLNDRQKMQYDDQDANCLTGKLVSRIPCS